MTFLDDSVLTVVWLQASPTMAVSGVLVSMDDGLSHLSPTLVDTSHVEGRITKVTFNNHPGFDDLNIEWNSH